MGFGTSTLGYKNNHGQKVKKAIDTGITTTLNCMKMFICKNFRN